MCCRYLTLISWQNKCAHDTVASDRRRETLPSLEMLVKARPLLTVGVGRLSRPMEILWRWSSARSRVCSTNWRWKNLIPSPFKSPRGRTSPRTRKMKRPSFKSLNLCSKQTRPPGRKILLTLAGRWWSRLVPRFKTMRSRTATEDLSLVDSGSANICWIDARVSRQQREYNVWFSFIQDQMGKKRTEFEMNVPPQGKFECIIRTTIFLPERPCNLLLTSLPQTVAKRSEEFANSRVILSNYNTTLSGVDVQNRWWVP